MEFSLGEFPLGEFLLTEFVLSEPQTPVVRARSRIQS
jgi:hypothetical protein